MLSLRSPGMWRVWRSCEGQLALELGRDDVQGVNVRMHGGGTCPVWLGQGGHQGMVGVGTWKQTWTWRSL